MIRTALLLLCSFPAQDGFGDRLVDLNLPASRVQTIVAALADASKGPLKISREVEGEIVLLSVRQTKTSDVMKRLADACGAVWKEEQGTWVLTRPNALRQEQEKQELQDRMADIKRAQAAIKEGLGKQPAFDRTAADQLSKDFEAIVEKARTTGAQMEDYEKFDKGTPVVRGLQRIAAELPPDVIARAQNGNRVVLSTSPTAAQLPLAEAFISTIVTQHRMYAEAHARLKAATPQGENNFSLGTVSNPTFLNGDPKAEAGYALLSILGWENSDSVYLSINVFDRQKRMMLQGMYSIGIWPEPERFDLGEAGKKTAEFSDQTKLLANAIRSGGQGPIGFMSMGTRTDSGEQLQVNVNRYQKNQPFLKLDDRLREIATNPEQIDPLSFAPSDSLAQVSREMNTNVVAVITDSVFPSAQNLSLNDKTTLQQMLNLFAREVRFSRDGDWIVGKAMRPIRSRGARAAREPFGILVRTLDKVGYLSLDTLARYATSGSPAPNTGLAGYYVRILNTTAIPNDLNENLTWQFVRLWGELRSNEQDALRKGGKVTIAQLNDAAKAQLNRVVYSYSRGPGPFSQAADEMMSWGAYDEERTVRMPRGVPGSGYLELPTKRSEAVLARMSNTGFTQMFDAPGLAGLQFQSQAQRLLEDYGYPPAFDKFALGTISNLRFTIMLEPDYGLTQRLKDAQITDPVAGDYQSLPATFRDQVANYLELYRKHMGDR